MYETFLTEKLSALGSIPLFCIQEKRYRPKVQYLPLVLWIREVYPGSQILIFTHPGSPKSQIPDPGSKNSNKRESFKKICCHIFFCCHKFHKTEKYFIFEMLKKKFWGHFLKEL
jgi:hypothetical protein